MRLIDADELLQEFEIETNIHTNNDCGFWHWTGIKAMIKRQPTAFDIEEVVKELEGLKTEYKEGWDEGNHEDDYGAYFAIENAIEIVRQGGVKNENSF